MPKHPLALYFYPYRVFAQPHPICFSDFIFSSLARKGHGGAHFPTVMPFQHIFQVICRQGYCYHYDGRVIKEARPWHIRKWANPAIACPDPHMLTSGDASVCKEEVGGQGRCGQSHVREEDSYTAEPGPGAESPACHIPPCPISGQCCVETSETSRFELKSLCECHSSSSPP